MQNPIIVALDVPEMETALRLAKQLAPVVGAFKIGVQVAHKDLRRIVAVVWNKVAGPAGEQGLQ